MYLTESPVVFRMILASHFGLRTAPPWNLWLNWAWYDSGYTKNHAVPTMMMCRSKKPQLISTTITVIILFLTKGQLISKRLLEQIVWTKIATKKFENFCPGGQIKKIKTLYYIKYPIIDVRKCPNFSFDPSLYARTEICQNFSLVKNFILKLSDL